MKILMLPVPSGKPWNGATIYSHSLGGSESAVAYLARSFCRIGNDVTVVSHGSPGIFDGVKYVSTGEVTSLLPVEWDFVISSRWEDVLRYPWKAKLKAFWTHDVPQPGVSHELSCDFVVCLTEFHKKLWGIEPTVVIGNGVDLSLFTTPEPVRDPNKLVWTSNPDRGLPVAASIFQDIRKRWPDLELHVYGRFSVYGWDNATEGAFLPRPEHMENVILHDSVSKPVLAKVLQESWAMFYPTYWLETYCIAALEAQAAGTPVISTPIGALLETVPGGILTYDYLNAISQLRNANRWEKLSTLGKEFAAENTWDKRAIEWLEAYNVQVSRLP